MAVVNLSQSNNGCSLFTGYYAFCLLLLVGGLHLSALADGNEGKLNVEVTNIEANSLDNNNESTSVVGGYLARIAHDSPEEVAQALKRAEELYISGE